MGGGNNGHNTGQALPLYVRREVRPRQSPCVLFWISLSIAQAAYRGAFVCLFAFRHDSLPKTKPPGWRPLTACGHGIIGNAPANEAPSQAARVRIL